MKHVFILIITLFIQATLCISQEQEHLSPTERKFQSIVREPLTMYKGFFRGGAAYTFATVDRIFDTDGNKIPIEGNANGTSWSISPFLQYGVTDRFQVEVSIPYVQGSLTQSVRYEIPQLDSVEISRWTRKTRGIGDVDVALSYQILHGTDEKPGLALFVQATLPTGEKNPKNVNEENPNEYDNPAGYGEYTIMSQLRFRKIQYPFAYNFFVGYKYCFPGEKILVAGDTEDRPFQSGASFHVSSSFNMHLNSWIVFRNFADVSFYEGSEMDEVKGEKTRAFNYTPGLSFQLKQFRLDQIVTFPIAGKNAGADVSYSFIVLYTF